jgi:hypothetical protein
VRCKHGKGPKKLIFVNLKRVLAIFYRVNLPTIFPCYSAEEAYTLWDIGASHKFVNPMFVDQVRDGETKTKSRRSGKMLFITAGQTKQLPLNEVRVTVDMGRYQYTSWFVIYKLAKFNIILGNNWMEEVSHHIDLQRNIIWLEHTASGGQFEYGLDGMERNE